MTDWKKSWVGIQAEWYQENELWYPSVHLVRWPPESEKEKKPDERKKTS